MEEDPMYNFLRKRGVSSEVIQRMKVEKITTETVCCIGPDSPELSSFLCLGDRIALHSYSKSHCQTSDKERSRDERKKKCYESIRKKLSEANETLPQANETQEQDSYFRSAKACKLAGNQNASKPARTIEFGWYHNGLGVRKSNGGGTRKIIIGKRSKHADLVKEGKNLYFPDGISRSGVQATKCVFTVRDFTHSEMAPETTVGELCDTVRMNGKLRFFLYTTGPNMKSSTNSKVRKSPSSTASCPPRITSADESNDSSVMETSVFEASNILADNSGSVSTIEIDSDLVDTSNAVQFGPFEADSHTSLSSTVPLLFDPTINSTFINQMNNAQEIYIVPQQLGHEMSTSASETMLLETVPDMEQRSPSTVTEILGVHVQTGDSEQVFPSPPSAESLDEFEREPRSPTPPLPGISLDRNKIKVNRNRVVKDMIAAFSDPDIVTKTIVFTFVDEKGDDQQGLSREAYTNFWLEFVQTSAKGEEERVPAVVSQFQLDEWKAIGRILLKGYFDHRVFPHQISKAFVVAMLFGEEAVSTELLMSSFYRYISEPEQIVVIRAIDGALEDEDDIDDFHDFLSRMHCTNIPTGEQVKQIIMQIAKAKLIQQPKYAMDSMSTIVKVPLLTNFENIENVLALYDKIKPTCRKVLKLLQVTPADADENRVFDFIKQLIRGFTSTNLVNFLHFVTAARIICVEKIYITFNSSRGLLRAPIAHTCGPVLEVSKTYTSFQDFRQDFLNVLSNHSGKFDFA